MVRQWQIAARQAHLNLWSGSDIVFVAALHPRVLETTDSSMFEKDAYWRWPSPDVSFMTGGEIVESIRSLKLSPSRPRLVFACARTPPHRNLMVLLSKRDLSILEQNAPKIEISGGSKAELSPVFWL